MKDFVTSRQFLMRILSSALIGIIVAVVAPDFPALLLGIALIMLWGTWDMFSIWYNNEKAALDRFNTCPHKSPIDAKWQRRECAQSKLIDRNVIWFLQSYSRRWVIQDAKKYCLPCDFYDMSTDEVAVAIVEYNREYKETHSDDWLLEDQIVKVKNKLC